MLIAKRRAQLIALAATLCALIIPLGSARADIVFCNKSGQSLIYIAIAYPQSDGSFISRGWMGLTDGNCAIFDTAIHVKTFYFRAMSEWRRVSRRRKMRQIWGKGRFFSLWESSNFQYWNAQERVLRASLEEFTQGPVAENGDVSATVTFTDTGSTVSVNGNSAPAGGVSNTGGTIPLETGAPSGGAHAQ